MAIDFSNLDPLRVDKNAEQKFTFLDIYLTDQPVWLMSRCADTDYNDEFNNEIMRRTAEKAGKKRVETADLIQTARDNDLELMARTCITGWGEVADAKGKAVGFTVENCIEFLRALPPHIFDRYRAWVTVPDNFSRRRVVSGTELGNSPPSA